MEHHLLGLKKLLKDKFTFLKRLNNNSGYLLTGIRNQQKIRKAVSEFIDWNREQFIDIGLNIYNLRLNKIEIVDINSPPNQLEITYAMKKEELTDPITKMRIYRSKKLSSISDKSLQSLINAGVQKGPSIRNCKDWRKILNTQFKIKTNSMGSYVSPEEKIKYYLKYFKDDMRIRNSHINIRLAGDGTEVGSNLSVLNFTFGFLDKMKSTAQLNPNCASGNFSLGTFLIKKEDYYELKIALKEIINELKLLKTIEIDGIEYTIESWLGGDLRFLALVLGRYFLLGKNYLKIYLILLYFLGLNASNANRPCPWCDSEKKHFKCSDHPINRIYNRLKKEVGQDKEPLIASDFFKTENIIPDILHMFLRVSEKLIHLLRNDLQQMETTFSESLELNVNFRKLVDF